MKVHEYYRLQPVRGDVGVEIEVEGDRVDEIAPVGWRVERDGSLRGQSAEYVMRKPVTLKNVHKYVSAVEKALGNVDAKVLDTGRAGVHVHVNMQQYTLTQVLNVICAYMIFEDLLTDFCGEHRVGNLFCLRIRDADRLLFALRERLRRKDFQGIGNNANRYAAINIESLPKFGSLEFRAMRSTVDPDEISNWAGMLIGIRDWAVQFKDPRDIIMAFSEQGARNVYEEVFQDYTVLLDYDEELLYEGMRNAQFLAFCTDEWEFDIRILLAEEAAKGMKGFMGRDAIKGMLDDPDDALRDMPFALHLYRELVEFHEHEEARLEEGDQDNNDPFLAA